MKRILLPAIFLMTLGCSPYFYTAEAVVISASDMLELDKAELSENCNISNDIPKHYVIHRKKYSLNFEVVALQIGVKVTSKTGEPLSLVATNLKANESRVTKISKEYSLYIPALNTNTVNITVLDHEESIGQEVIKVERRKCRATTIDAL